MKLFLDRDFFDNPKPPRLFLCTTGKKIIQELPSYDESLDGKWGAYSEASFSIDRQYVDVLTGETKVHPAFDKAEGLRKVYMENLGYFVIQDPDATYGDKDSKTMSCFSSEYETANKYLENFRINTGEIDSAEVMYLETIHGYNYTVDKDNLYAKARGVFDSDESYYVQEYTDNDSYTYEQVQILNASEYADYDGSTVAKTLYVKNYPNVRFYWPNKPELSLLNIIFKKIPGWKIGHVDTSLRRKERMFDEDRIAVYDFLMNDVQDTFKCVVEWDTLTNKVNFYEEAEDGITEANEIQERWETDVFISRDNLANEIKINYSTDDIKTKLKVTGADDLDIREVNLGKNYIMNLDYYHTPDWMEPDIFEGYDAYLNAVEEYTPQYTKAMQNWVGAYNKWNEFMNAVPVEGNVVLVGDPFEKLYCVYTPIDTAYAKISIDDLTSTVDTLYSDAEYAKPIDTSKLSNGDVFVVQGYELIYDNTNNNFECGKNITELNLTEKNGLLDRLTLYHINEDVNYSKTDNILLRLKNQNSDITTIRIYNASGKNTDDEKKLNPEYKIQVLTTYAQSGITSDAKTYSMRDWISGKLTAEYMRLVEYSPDDISKENPIYPTVQYIGTMGAYFVLAKDELIVNDDGLLEISQDYLNSCGVNLLKEKHQTYTTIFQTQTEAMFSQEKYQCMAQKTEPRGSFSVGTRWLDTDSIPVVLKEYDGYTWKKIPAAMSEDEQKNYENYQRYIDNYEKIVAVQNVLVEKERLATYIENGYSVANRSIDINLYKKGDDGVLRYNGQTLEGDLHRAAQAHFGSHTVTRSRIDYAVPVYYFTTSFDTATYIKNTELYSKQKKYYVKRYYSPYFITNEADFSKQPLYVVTSKNPDMYEQATEYDASKKYYIKLTSPFYALVQIDDQETFDKYDGATDETTLYTMTGGNLFAVYLNGTTPYVAYADSQGVYQAIMEWISKETNLEKFFPTEDQWARLSPLIREDEFSDSNFLLTGYESEEERLEICKELFESANKELNAICRPSLEFSMEMANILALPEFKPLMDKFQLGNFVRVHIRDDYVKRARLFEVHLNFNDLSDFNCTFGNLVTTKSEIDKHADLLSQAVTAGKQVATSAGDWQKAVDKSNKLEQDIANGLQNSALEVGRASGQSIVWDEHGIWGRKLIEGTTDQYHPEQFRIINNKLVFSNDGFKTSKAVFGSYTVNGETRWGPLAEYVTADTIEGKLITGGSIEIGTGDNKFIVHEDGSVEIKVGGQDKYASTDALKEIDNAYRFHTVLSYDKSTVFADKNQSCTMTCKVYEYGVDITSNVIAVGGKFSWIRASADTAKDAAWNAAHIKTGANANETTLYVDDVEGNAQFSCAVDFDETKLPTT